MSAEYRARLEEEILGGLLVGGADAGAVLADLRPEMFATERHRRILLVLRECLAAPGALETAAERLDPVDADYLRRLVADAPDEPGVLRENAQRLAAVGHLPHLRGFAGRLVEARTDPDALAAAVELREAVERATTAEPGKPETSAPEGDRFEEWLAPLKALPEKPEPAALNAALLVLRSALGGADAQVAAVARSAALDALKARKVPGARELLDAALASLHSTAGDPKPEADLGAVAAELLAKLPEEARARGEALLRGEPLDELPKLFERLGHVGEPDAAATFYLVCVSSLLPRPLGAELVAASGAGKSHLADTGLELFPAECIDRATSASAHALYYATRDLRHAIVARSERDLRAEEAHGSLPFREMLSRGKLERDVVVERPSGGFETKKYVVDGPVAYVETTTSTRRLDEDASRMVRLVADESTAQTRRVHKATARGFARPEAEEALASERAAWRSLYLMLRREVLDARRPLRVVVPFAEWLAAKFPAGSLRTRRAFPQTLALVQAVALLRLRHHEEREEDGVRLVEADGEDWKRARPLALALVRRALSTIDDGARRLLDLLRENTEPGAEFTTARAAELAGVSDRRARDRLRTLRELGAVEPANPDGNKGGRGRVARWRLLAAEVAAATGEEFLPEGPPPNGAPGFCAGFEAPETPMECGPEDAPETRRNPDETRRAGFTEPETRPASGSAGDEEKPGAENGRGAPRERSADVRLRCRECNAELPADRWAGLCFNCHENGRSARRPLERTNR